MIPLMYANNADIKYPLSDFHEAGIPNASLLDLSLTVPDARDPVLAVYRTGPGFVFVSIEDSVDRHPIASVIITDPVAARVYPLEMSVDGHGWIVFGPQAVLGESYLCSDVIELDPETVLPLVQTAPALSLTVNGFPREVRNILELVSGSVFLNITVEDSVIYIDRNDDVLSQDDLVSLGVEQAIDAQTQDQLLYTVAGTPPDDNGNIDIVILGCAEDCGDVQELTIPRGDTGQGVTEELPLDVYSDRVYSADDPCAPEEASSDSSEESEEPDIDPYEGCTEISRVAIIDPSTGSAIGTLYTVVE